MKKKIHKASADIAKTRQSTAQHLPSLLKLENWLRGTCRHRKNKTIGSAASTNIAKTRNLAALHLLTSLKLDNWQRDVCQHF